MSADAAARPQGVEDDLRTGVAGRAVAGRRLAVLGLVARLEVGAAGEVADGGCGRVGVLGIGAGQVQERVLGLAGAVVDAVGADVRDVSKAGLDGRLEDPRTAGRGDAAEVDRLRAQGRGGRHDRGIVGVGLRHAVALDDGPAVGLQVRLEGVGDALPERLGVIDDVHLLGVQVFEDVLGRGRTLVVVRRHDADVVDPVWERLANVERAELWLGQTLVGVGRAALQEARLVRDRDLGQRDARVERADDRDDVGVADDRGHVVGAGLRIVRSVDRVVEDRRVGDLDGVSAGPAARFLDRELDAVDDRLRSRELAALERELDRDLDSALAGVSAGDGAATGARCGGPAARCGGPARGAARRERQDADGRERTYPV